MDKKHHKNIVKASIVIRIVESQFGCSRVEYMAMQAADRDTIFMGALRKLASIISQSNSDTAKTDAAFKSLRNNSYCTVYNALKCMRLSDATTLMKYKFANFHFQTIQSKSVCSSVFGFIKSKKASDNSKWNCRDKPTNTMHRK